MTMPAATLLPLVAVRILQHAASVDPQSEVAESYERTLALDHAIKRVQQMYPEYFNLKEKSC